MIKIIRVQPLIRKEFNKDELKNTRCAMCNKMGTKEEFGGHLCSAKCEYKYSENEEKYFR